ncbi:MAG: beta-ketoacyl synthase chain length factor [Pseudomonadota bacterium]
MRVYLEGIGVIGPGLNGWTASRPILAGDTAYAPTPTQLAASDLLPVAERRRAGIPIKLALAVAQEAHMHAGRAANSTATVFTSSGGDNDNVHAINTILATAPREVSPTRFMNSVHNSAAGYWCIAAQTHEPSTSLCAYNGSFAAGLLEAAAQVSVDLASVALVAYDHPHPEPLNAVRPIAGCFGVALIIVPYPTERTFAVLDVAYVARHGEASSVRDPALEALRLGNPSARSLPLLAALACAQPAQVVLDYLDDAHLTVVVTPC